MKTLKRSFWGFLLFLSLLWWLADTTKWSSLNDIFAYRGVLMQYTGIIAIGVMSVATILSVRPILLERPFDGLDKMYRLHKWLGIAGLVMAVAHWLVVEGPRWMVSLGWIVRTSRRIPPAMQEGSLQHLLSLQRGLAAKMGEYAFYLAVLLIVLALIKRFPYRQFFQTHRILALTYLALVFHSVVFMRYAYWSTPLGIFMLILMGLGSISAVLALFRKRVGRSPIDGQVSAIEMHPAIDLMEVSIRMDKGWAGHAAGQFAFVTFHKNEGPHPFTISSPGEQEGNIKFLIKGIGDYTQTLPERLRVGDQVKVEGPYGRFNFDGDTQRQIWIAGGVGIAPFLAKMRERARQSDGKVIELFYSTSTHNPAFAAELSRTAAEAKVQLHYRSSKQDGRFDLETILNSVPEWREADVWFCGPESFGAMLQQGFANAGVPEKRFHRELFEMR
ncbi:MAG: Ferric reductase domain protein transrane component domain protein [Burkholderiaceae bacterium]|nr:Ferric reductase domain protein transrane component domain protein [Burkholderiaceae bacterium]